MPCGMRAAICDGADSNASLDGYPERPKCYPHNVLKY
jgi:hypothetical protein